MNTMYKTALIGITFALYSTAASAQLTSQGMLDQVITEFSTRAAAWQTVIMNAATFLFWTLGTISLVITFGFMALRKADIGEFFAEFIRFSLFLGFFLWLLRHGPEYANSIIKSLARLGEQASGLSSVTPSGIVDVGFLILSQAFNNSSRLSPVDSVIGVLLSVGILVLLTIVAVNMLLLFVSGWLLMYAGIFFLGFGGSRWTSDIAINYFKTVLGVAVQIMTMVLLIGIGNDLLSTFYAKMNTGTLNFNELGVMLVFCVVLLMLANRVPPLVAGVISGAGIGSAGGIGSFSAGAALGATMGAASVAAGAASMVGAAVVGSATNLAGGASALKAAFIKAQASMAGEAGTGLGVIASMGGADTSGSQGASGSGSSAFARAAGLIDSPLGAESFPTGSISSKPKGSDNTGNIDDRSRDEAGEANGGEGMRRMGTLASSRAGFARAATLAAGTAGELVKGAGTVLKGKAVQLADGFQERMDKTIGGQAATAIRSRTPAETLAFEGDSLGSEQVGNEAADPDGEVAAFVKGSTEH